MGETTWSFNPRVVIRTVELSIGVHRRGYQCLDVSTDGHITLVKARLPACLVDGRDRGFAALPIQIGSHHACAGPPEGQGRGAADPCTSAGDDYRLTLEIVIHSALPSRMRLPVHQV